MSFEPITDPKPITDGLTFDPKHGAQFTPSPDQPCCSNCRFFCRKVVGMKDTLGTISTVVVFDLEGECRAKFPTDDRWPEVVAWDWCGQFKSKTGAP